MRLTAEQLPAALARGLTGAYLVSGDEPLLVGEAADAIRAAARAKGFAERVVCFIEGRAFDWDALGQDIKSLSLFAARRIFDLRMPTGKPDKGAAMLLEIATRPPPDVLCLVITDKLDSKTGEAPWVRAFERHGAWVRVATVDRQALPAWLRARAGLLKIGIEPAAAMLIADRVEGNLLAAQQELEKLALLANGASIGTELVTRSVGDSARFDVMQLGQAAAAGEGQRALRVLLGLKSEGVEPTLILWALVRELRGLWQMQERSRLRSKAQGGGWYQAAAPSPEAMARSSKLPLAALLRQAHHTDRVIKGLAGGDAWTAVTGLTAALAGALQATADSGRVAV